MHLNFLKNAVSTNYPNNIDSQAQPQYVLEICAMHAQDCHVPSAKMRRKNQETMPIES